MTETGFSRFPVTDPDGKWVGYVHVKDVLNNLAPIADPSTTMLDSLDVRPLIEVEAGVNFDVAMRRMRLSSNHVAAVVDDSNTIIGMVTLEDIIEELVGTVRDWTHD